MDRWFDDGDDGWAAFSSDSLSSELIGPYYWGSFSAGGVSSLSCAPGLASTDVEGYLELEDSSELVGQQLYQADVFMGCDSGGNESRLLTLSSININMESNHLFPQDFILQPQSEEFVLPDPRHTSSKSSPLQSLSTGSTEYSCLLVNNANTTATKHATQPNYNIFDHLPFATPSRDDVEITKAMAAVISASSSSSSISSMLPHPLRQAQTHESQVNDRFGAFKPYNSDLDLKFEPKKNSCSQKMIKMFFSVLRRINQMRDKTQTQEPRSTSKELQHIISERKRREKLNGSFHALRLLLPPGPKKDKGSVLANTRNYLNTLKAKISKLQEENRVLEMHLSPTSESKEVDGSIEKGRVQTVKGFKLKSGAQQTIVEILVRIECDVIELVLFILEYLKGMRVSGLISVDVNMCSPQRDLFARAAITLEIKDSNWDERSFKEAMNSVLDGMATIP